MTIKQTAGRDALGNFAPDFAHFNDDVLFGENWNIPDISLKTRSLITVVALMAQGITDNSLAYHIENAKAHGVTQKEMAAAITHVAFYAGWPKAWATFNLAKEVYADEAIDATNDSITADNKKGVESAEEAPDGASECTTSVNSVETHGGFFGLGEPNDAFAQYFIGQSYLNPLTATGDYLPIFNVTFEPGCRNNWHIHHASASGGQVLICIDGEGWYQEDGKPARALKPGDIVEIPANVKHWHGAKANSWFSHLAFECPGEGCSNEWCEPVDDSAYNALEA